MTKIILNPLNCCEETLRANFYSHYFFPSAFSKIQTVADIKVCGEMQFQEIACNFVVSCVVCRHKVLRMNREDLVINQDGWVGFVVG
jgi:hypothetical protein